MNATNGIGWQVEELHAPQGWCAVSAAFKTMQDARAEMLRMPADGVERRVYEALVVPA